MNISILGVSGSGKTCYLYAMSQILRIGATEDDFTLQIRVSDRDKRAALEKGFTSMVDDKKWPDNTDVESDSKGNIKLLYDYNFKVAFDLGDDYNDWLIPNMNLIDYKGGALTLTDDKSNKIRKAIYKTFDESSALIFIVDGETLLYAMPPQDRHPNHRQLGNDPSKVLRTQTEIMNIENLLDDYKIERGDKPVAPVLIAISKDDTFYDEELKRAKTFLKHNLRSIFAKGSGIDAAITSFSLGDALGIGPENSITGALCMDISHNIHLPIVFGLYAFFSTNFNVEKPKEEQDCYLPIMKCMRKMMRGKVEFIKDGYQLFEV